MAHVWEKALSILARNLNSGPIYLITTLTELLFKFSVFTCQTDKDCNWNGYCHQKEEYCICLEGYHYRHDCSEFGCKYFKAIQNFHLENTNIDAFTRLYWNVIFYRSRWYHF